MGESGGFDWENGGFFRVIYVFVGDEMPFFMCFMCVVGDVDSCVYTHGYIYYGMSFPQLLIFFSTEYRDIVCFALCFIITCFTWVLRCFNGVTF